MSEDLLEIAVTAAREAGALLLARWADARTAVATKSSATDMVSDADRAAEEAIRGVLRTARPGDGLLGEEGGEDLGSTGVRWVVDPLDGTTNYLYGIPHWAVSIACEDDEGIIAGVVLDPVRDELFSANRGGGARLNGSPVHCSGAADLSRALLATGFSYRSEERDAQGLMTAFLLPRVRDIRRGGSAALDLAWTACGRVDCFFEAQLAPWDRAAGELLVTEAGGSVAHRDVLPSGPAVLAAGPALWTAFEVLIDGAVARMRPGEARE